jgi:hypothetical protein
MTGIILEPAYGRSYKTIEAARIDWRKGKDFKLPHGGPYCSQRDEATLLRQYGAPICIRIGHDIEELK